MKAEPEHDPSKSYVLMYHCPESEWWAPRATYEYKGDADRACEELNARINAHPPAPADPAAPKPPKEVEGYFSVETVDAEPHFAPHGLPMWYVVDLDSNDPDTIGVQSAAAFGAISEDPEWSVVRQFGDAGINTYSRVDGGSCFIVAPEGEARKAAVEVMRAIVPSLPEPEPEADNTHLSNPGTFRDGN